MMIFTARRASLLALLALVAVTAAGAALRLHDVGHSLWLDELHTAWCAAGDLGDVAPRARIGNYSPAYFWLVWASARCVGLTEWGVRLPSLLAGIALIPVMYCAVRRITGSRLAGLTAAAIVALDGGFYGWYSQEARPYALVQLLAVVHVWVFTELMDGERSRRAHAVLRALFVLVTVGLFYLHYTTVLLFCGELAWYGCLWLLPRARLCRPRYSPAALAIDLALAAAACLPAAGHLLEIFQRRANWSQFVRQPTWHELLTMFQPAPWALAVPLIAWCAVFAVAHRFRHRKPPIEASPSVPPQGRSLLLPYCWYAAPLVVAAILSYAEIARVCYPRYLMASAVALPVAAAFGVAVLGRTHLALGLLAAVLAVAVIRTPPSDAAASADVSTALPYRSFTGHFVEDWRGAIEYVRQRDHQEGKSLFLWSGLIEAEALREDAGSTATGSPQDSADPTMAARLTASHADQKRLREYLLFPINGPYALGVAMVASPLALPGERLVSSDDAQRIREHGGGWFIFRSPDTIYPHHPKPVERLARQLVAELAGEGVAVRVTHRQSFRGLAVIHVTAD